MLVEVGLGVGIGEALGIGEVGPVGVEIGGGLELGIGLGVAALIVNTWATLAAAAKVPSPIWVEITVQEPARSRVRVDPELEQSPVEEYATGRLDEAMALKFSVRGSC